MPTSFYLFHSSARGTGAAAVNLDKFEPDVNHKVGVKVSENFTRKFVTSQFQIVPGLVFK